MGHRLSTVNIPWYISVGFIYPDISRIRTPLNPNVSGYTWLRTMMIPGLDRFWRWIFSSDLLCMSIALSKFLREGKVWLSWKGVVELERCDWVGKACLSKERKVWLSWERCGRVGKVWLSYKGVVELQMCGWVGKGEVYWGKKGVVELEKCGWVTKVWLSCWVGKGVVELERCGWVGKCVVELGKVWLS